MPRTVPNAFTLIELLVVIAITAVIGIYTLINSRSFGEDQNLKNASLDIQSLLRQAQTNATANAKCNIGYGAIWQVEFANLVTINLKCMEPVSSSVLKKTLQLDANNTLKPPITGTGFNCPTLPPFTINFDPLTGKVGFGDSRCTSLTITLQNNKTGSTKSFTTEQGGRIYGQ
ncbi:MAG: prepilin-type N-terminal cleavage/methylation domain-containing protein [Candidatus Daviesbacteria bacterium]|nr:prepilin-type N-terminal cleavage/methylation domain-containing protein [Candidatus Daviesbacteria bacterium]